MEEQCSYPNLTDGAKMGNPCRITIVRDSESHCTMADEYDPGILRFLNLDTQKYGSYEVFDGKEHGCNKTALIKLEAIEGPDTTISIHGSDISGLVNTIVKKLKEVTQHGKDEIS
jgi:hypothetical protein